MNDLIRVGATAILSGAVGVVLGVLWFVNGLTLDAMARAEAGGQWIGPLIVVAGVCLMGFRKWCLDKSASD